MRSKYALPPGAEMWDRTNKVWNQVFELLTEIPHTRGSDRRLELEYRIRFEGYKPWVRMSKNDAINLWEGFMSGETIIRRRAEIQNETIGANGDGTAIYKYPHLRPSERVKRKRVAREGAANNYFRDGTYRLTDFNPPEPVPSR